MRPGIYVHVPFCAHRCWYCDFAVTVGADEEFVERYVAALHAEIDRLAEAGPARVAPAGAGVAASWPEFGSVFVGGGTPTLLAPAALADLITHVRQRLPVTADAEITVEANPDTVEAAGLAMLVEAGLTRLSLGAQSFDGEVLRFLDRDHAAAAAPRAVTAARTAGVPAVSVDLIYGAPGETAQSWRATLDAAIATGVEHVSCYALTVEPSTAYGVAVRRGTAPAPDDDVSAARMATADERLAAAGFERYEISNWARPGYQSRHNRVYWAGGNWLAAGAGAHGHWAGGAGSTVARRWWNVRPTQRYVERIEADGDATGNAELLDAADRRLERLLMGLRVAEGVARAEVAPLDDRALDTLVDRGLLACRGERLVLTPAGRPLADSVVAALAG